MPPQEPEGSVSNLPGIADIEAAEASVETDIEAMFGMDDADDSLPSPGGETNPAPGADGAAGAGGGEGSSSAPVSAGEAGQSPDGSAAPVQTATQGEGTSPPPSAQQPAQAGQPTPGGPQPSAAQGAIDENALRVQSLEATVQALQAELARSRAIPPQAQAPQQPGQTQQGGGPGPADDLPRYALSLPQQVAAALVSGDDQQTLAGITNMMNSLATIVHHNVRQEMRQNFAALVGAARQQEYETTQSNVIALAREDYFSAFPDHRSPLVMPLVQAEAVAMTAEYPGLGWNEQYRNALGQRVNARLEQLRQTGAANGGTPPPQQPAAMIPTGPRPAPTGSELTGGDLIMDTFS